MGVIWKYGRYFIFSVLGVYLIFMVAWPWSVYEGKFDLHKQWHSVQTVWAHWQTLNAAMIALASSIIALNIAQYVNKQNRERKFKAALVFLPQELSTLSEYCGKSIGLYGEIWNRLREKDEMKLQPLDQKIPEFPSSHVPVLKECLEHSEEIEFDGYLIAILKELQIQHSQMVGSYQEFSGRKSPVSSTQSNLILYLYKTAKIQVLIDRLFPYARKEKSLEIGPMTSDRFKSVLDIGGIKVENIFIPGRDGKENFTLEGFIERAVERENKKDPMLFGSN